MDQNDAINKLIVDLKQRRPVSKDLESLISEYLGLAYAIGYNVSYNNDVGRKGKRINQIKDGIIVDTWNRSSDAATAYGVSRVAIHKALKTGTKVAGYNWKFDV